MRWAVIAILGAAAVVAALMFRDELHELVGDGDDTDTLVFRFDGPVTPEIVERARALVGERLVDLPVTVHAGGDRLEIEVPDAATSMEVSIRMASAARFVPRVELRILDYDPAYLRELAAPLRTNQRAKELGVELVVDSLGYHLQAPTAGMYVNTGWAQAHGCPTTHRIEGTGVYCTVTGEDRISAVLNGDAALFAEPVASGVELAADRELVIGTDGVRARAYVYERTPIVVEAAAIATADTRGGVLVLSLSPAAAEAVRRRAHDPTVQLARLVGGMPSAARFHDDGVLEVAIDAADARRFVSALAYAHLPQRLREAPME